MDCAHGTRTGPMILAAPAGALERLRAPRRALHARKAQMHAIMLACIVSVLAPSPATAAGLGQVTQQSALGQPLRVVVPVILGAGEELPTECFKLASAAGDADGIPQILFGRVVVERTAAGTQLVVSNSRSVNDPVVKLTLQAGCDVAVRREYTLLMDPPAIEPAIVAADSAPRTAVVAPPPPIARQPARPARGASAVPGMPAARSRATAPQDPSLCQEVWVAIE